MKSKMGLRSKQRVWSDQHENEKGIWVIASLMERPETEPVEAVVSYSKKTKPENKRRLQPVQSSLRSILCFSSYHS